jgi:hypothetical protein
MEVLRIVKYQATLDIGPMEYDTYRGYSDISLQMTIEKSSGILMHIAGKIVPTKICYQNVGLLRGAWCGVVK